MKRRIIIFVVFFAFNLLTAQTKGNSIIGKWIGTDAVNQTAGIEFDENGKAKLLMFDKEIPALDYKVDYQKDPILISLMAKSNGKPTTIFGLIEFIDADTIKWEVFPIADKQPKAFSEKSNANSIILRRNKT